jgi:hypothetical protein
MKPITTERRKLLDEEKVNMRRMALLEDVAYQRLLSRAREYLRPDCGMPEFQLAIRELVPDPFEFREVWKPELKRMYAEYRQREAWTRKVKVVGGIPDASLRPLGRMLLALARQEGGVSGETNR